MDRVMQDIETTRLLLRRFTSYDLDDFALINADPDVMRYIGEGKPQSKAQTQMRLDAILDHWEQHGFGLWAAVDKASGAMIGFCGIQYLDNTSEIEVGYRLAKRLYLGGGGDCYESSVGKTKHVECQ